MIMLYSGTPGSGKSLHMASNIYYNLRYGRDTIANFEINTACCRRQRGQFVYCPNDKLSVQFLIDYSVNYFKTHKFVEGKIELYIDEAQLLFNAREWGKVGRSDWTAFFTQHRKYGYNIYLIAQFDRMLDRQIRSLIEYEYIHRKMSNFGIKGKLLSILFGGHTFVSVKVWYPMSEKVGSDIFHYRKKFGRMYNSYALFSADIAGSLNNRDDSLERRDDSLNRGAGFFVHSAGQPEPPVTHSTGPPEAAGSQSAGLLKYKRRTT